MRDALPKKPEENEPAIVNLDVSSGPGTHWVCYYKRGSLVDYYDSFAYSPPIEIMKYLKGCEILYNYEVNQKLGTVYCGYRYPEFLHKKLYNKDGWKNI